MCSYMSFKVSFPEANPLHSELLLYKGALMSKSYKLCFNMCIQTGLSCLFSWSMFHIEIYFCLYVYWWTRDTNLYNHAIWVHSGHSSISAGCLPWFLNFPPYLQPFKLIAWYQLSCGSLFLQQWNRLPLVFWAAAAVVVKTLMLPHHSLCHWSTTSWQMLSLTQTLWLWLQGIESQILMVINCKFE